MVLVLGLSSFTWFSDCTGGFDACCLVSVWDGGLPATGGWVSCSLLSFDVSGFWVYDWLIFGLYVAYVGLAWVVNFDWFLCL